LASNKCIDIYLALATFSIRDSVDSGQPLGGDFYEGVTAVRTHE
jgi:hypothetical protein